MSEMICDNYTPWRERYLDIALKALDKIEGLDPVTYLSTGIDLTQAAGADQTPAVDDVPRALWVIIYDTTKFAEELNQ